jgi:hypothetical protein
MQDKEAAPPAALQAQEPQLKVKATETLVLTKRQSYMEKF